MSDMVPTSNSAHVLKYKLLLFVTFKSSAWREIWLKCSELGFWEGNGIAFDRSFKLAEYQCNKFKFVWNLWCLSVYEEVHI